MGAPLLESKYVFTSHMRHGQLSNGSRLEFDSLGTFVSWQPSHLWDLPQLRDLPYLIDLSRTSWTTSNTGISPTLRTKLLCLPLTSFNLLFKFGNLNFFPFPTSFFLPWFLKFYFRPRYTWTPPADC